MISNPFYNISKNIYAYVSTLPYSENYYSIIEGIVQCFPGAASIKDSSTFSYVAANYLLLDNFGYSSPQEIIGKSLHDVANKMKHRWPKNFEETITEYEHYTLTNNKPMISVEEIPYLNIKGDLVANCLNKIPLFNDKKEPIGLLTLALNTTPYKDREILRQLYQQLYKNKREALDRYLIHTGLEKYTTQYNKLGASITNRELDCLILRASGRSTKETALQLSLSSRTVEAYINQIKEKFSYINVKSMLEDFFHCYFTGNQLSTDTG